MILIIADSLSVSGDYARGLERADEVLSLTLPGSRLWSAALVQKVMAASLHGLLSPVMERVTTLHSIEPEPKSAAAFVVSLARISAHLLASNQFAIAEDCALRMEQLGGSLAGQDPDVRAWIEFVRALRAQFQRNPWASLTHYGRAEASFAEAGDHRYMSAARMHQGLCLILLGAHAEAQELLEALLGSGEAVLMLLDGFARWFLAVAKAERGALDEALGEATALAAVIPLAVDPGTDTDLLLLIAKCQLRRGDLEAAERQVLTAFDVLSEHPRSRALALTTLADIRLAQRRSADALILVEQALAALQSIPPAYRSVPYLSLIHAEALDATGDHTGARAAIAAARAELLVRADRIGDPAYRKTFLENVSENARLMERAQEWLGEPASSPA